MTWGLTFRNFGKGIIMKRLILSLLFISFGTAVFCTTWTIVNSSFTFSPASITITHGDDVSFVLETVHNAVEVSQATWNANGNTPLAGGFSVVFGGGLVSSTLLTVGTHYYVCSPHASLGMKGIIIVNVATSVRETQQQMSISVYPNPAGDILSVKAADNMKSSPYFILDQSGRLIQSGNLNGGDNNIEISRLARGIYFFRLPADRKRSYKVIKN